MNGAASLRDPSRGTRPYKEQQAGLLVENGGKGTRETGCTASEESIYCKVFYKNKLIEKSLCVISWRVTKIKENQGKQS